VLLLVLLWVWLVLLLLLCFPTTLKLLRGRMCAHYSRLSGGLQETVLLQLVVLEQ
jgi:hypothetical protein